MKLSYIIFLYSDTIINIVYNISNTWIVHNKIYIIIRIIYVWRDIMQNKDHVYNKEIGRRVRSIRMMNNLTQDNLGDMLGITGQAIQKIEAGENMLTVNSLIIMCKKLDVTPDYILFNRPKTERDIELSFETLEGNEKLQLLFRLLLYVSKVENEKYRNLLESIIDTLD